MYQNVFRDAELGLDAVELRPLFRCGFLVGFMQLAALAQAATSTVWIPWGDEKQTMDGFGTCQGVDFTPYLYFWPEPQRSEILDLAFSPTKGIGLSILRSSIPPGDPSNPVPALEPSPGVWNHNDTHQVWLMHEATKRGVEKLFGSCWSPPAWMKSSGTVRGGQLKPANYQDFADYLAHYAKEYAAANNVKIYAVSMANEPDNDTTDWASCAWTSPQFATFLSDYLRPTFAAKSIDANVIAPEAAVWDRADTFLADTYTVPNALARLDIVAAHLYGGTYTHRYTTALNQGKRVWETEASLSFPVWTLTGALSWAKAIHQGLTSAQVSAWHWWVLAVWPNSDESLIGLDSPKRTYYVSKTFWALGNFSKFIRPGYVRLNATANPVTNLFTSAFKDPTTGRHVIVAVNTGTAARDLKFNLIGFSGGMVTPYVTDGTRNLEAQSPVPLAGTVTVPGQAVVTYVSAPYTASSEAWLDPAGAEACGD